MAEPTGGKWVVRAALPLMFLIAFLYAWSISADIPLSFPDQATYLVCARGLAAGQGHTLVSLDPPVPFTVQPPLFPFMLSLVIRAAGMHVPLMKIMILMIYATGLACFFDFARIRGESVPGIAAVLLAAAMPFSLAYSRMILSELPYAGLSFISLWAFERWTQGARKTPWLVLALVFCVLSFYTRSVGLVLAAAMIGAFFLDRRIDFRADKKAFVFFSIVCAAAMAAWWLRCYLIRGAYGFEYFYEIIGGTWAPHPEEFQPASSLPGRIAANIAVYEKLMSQFIAPSLRFHPVAAAVGGAVALGLFLPGYVQSLVRKRSALEIYIVLYAALIILWDFNGMRFLLPLAAPVLYYMGKTVGMAADALRRPGKNAVVLAGAALLLGVFLRADLAQLTAPDGGMKIQRRLNTVPLFKPPWFDRIDARPVEIGKNFQLLPSDDKDIELISLLYWIKGNIGPGKVFFVPDCNYFFLVTGHTCSIGFSPFTSRDRLKAEGLAALVAYKADYVLISDADPIYSNIIIQAMRESPGSFELVHRIEGTDTALYRFLGGAVDAQSPK